MSQYKISVIVSTHNTGNYLNEFLNSIKSQSIGFENIEVIFVDDKSTDNYTLDLLKDFNESYENVKVKFSDVNSGFPGKGRNTGLKLADSDYVIFADHDDTYTRNAFEVMYDKIAENDDMFFMVEPLVNSRMLSYQYGDYMLNFFFDSNDKLFYTTIYNLHVWTE